MNPLATLLHLANSQPPWQFKREFYAIKERLLKRYGTPDDADVQHLPGKQCWTCDGTGLYSKYSECRKCWGTGWYLSPVWVCLDRYRWGKYVFHMPGEVSYTKPEPDITRIFGYVEHRGYGKRSDEAFAWLCLLCGEWRLLWRWLNASYYTSFPWWPWLSVQLAIGTVSYYWERWNRKCVGCGKMIRGNGSWHCDACREECNSVSEDIPF